jgi:transcriptional regulator of acetoin/glycerol metabolism
MQSSNQVRQHAQKISAVAALGEDEPDLAFESLILKSWRRCLTRGDFDPLRPRHLAVLQATQLKEVSNRYESLLRLAYPALFTLAKTLAGTNYAVLLTDNRGLILKHIVEASIEEQFRSAELCLGADWGESQAGTNGIGTCVAEDRPVTVHKDEHLLSQNIGLTCSAAPIHDPHGNLLAVLDSSSCSSADSRTVQAHTRALVSLYARLIESQHFLREFRNQKILRFQDSTEVVALPDKALIALGEDNRVLAVNDVAMRLLAVPQRSQIVGKELSEIVGSDLDDLFAGGGTCTETIHPFRDQRSGTQFFGLLYKHKAPKRRQGLTIPPTDGVPDPCRGNLCQLGVLAGNDLRMQDAARRALKVVDKRIPILIQGETGTGKDLFAQAIHRASARKDNPFVALNCASIPESLIESELFGYKHGAFTGASREGRRGKIIESSGGTLFLDEIGDMPLNLQSRLLRVLEMQEVVPLGSERAVQVELNVVAATHQNLPRLITDGLFREDLYYRLNGITIHLPPLRNRVDLNEIIMKVFRAENDTGVELRIHPETMTRLLSYTWPGNLRQLRNVVRTAIALSDHGTVEIGDINLPPTETGRAPEAPGAVIEQSVEAAGHSEETEETNPLSSAEQQVIMTSLDAHGWNISRTAETLAMSRNTLYRKMRKHGISPDGN